MPNQNYRATNSVIRASNLLCPNLVIDQGILMIGPKSFVNNKCLESVVMPSSLKSIAFGAFKNCSNLHEVILNEGLTEIQDEAFENCLKLTSIVIPSSVCKVGNRAFFNCPNLKVVIFEGSDTVIGDDVFERCEITSEEGSCFNDSIHMYS